MNKIELLGRLCKDPEIRYTQTGTAVATFTLAVNRRYAKNQEQTADFINIVVWNKAAEFVSNNFSKGQMMALTGRLQIRNYEDGQGNRKYITEVVAEEIFFAGTNDNQKLDTFSSKGSNYIPDELNQSDLPF